MHDSTSMKTIAMMTMCFLPATFFAALFAVPSLQWDKPTVIGSRFWVYWAVTIPTTILVFVIWFGMMYREELCERVKGKSRRAGEKWKGEKSVMGRIDASA
jgi:FtsH-binding integral membrane protein